MAQPKTKGEGRLADDVNKPWGREPGPVVGNHCEAWLGYQEVGNSGRISGYWE